MLELGLESDPREPEFRSLVFEAHEWRAAISVRRTAALLIATRRVGQLALHCWRQRAMSSLLRSVVMFVFLKSRFFLGTWEEGRTCTMRR
jgi:hypothetical protein